MKEKINIKWICPNDYCAEYWAIGTITFGEVINTEDIIPLEQYKDKVNLTKDSQIVCPKCGHVYTRSEIHKLITDAMFKPKNKFEGYRSYGN